MDERVFFQMVADRTQLSRQEAADLTPRHSRCWRFGRATVRPAISPWSFRSPVGAGNGVTLCDLRVCVDEAAESIASMDASVVGGDEWFGLGEPVRRPLSKGSMRPVFVAVLRILADERRRWRSPMIRVRSVASRRHDPIQRSAIVFIRGTAGRVGITRMSVAWKTESKLLVKYAPRSRMRNVIDSAWSPRSMR
ncbi:hypothetical protein [Streptomyces sp. NEAU-YJ-81]|uniref:hypothetical protein n=1 Tax=Streptomyces sp. NEAU-YJ-81 TaxID=2820288 RepID=UPI001FBA6632|nr:hypothetical protein [Streptomyces sp. NEAU-YJ-81]